MRLTRRRQQWLSSNPDPRRVMETPADSPTSETSITALTWGIKRSFIRYIGSLPDTAHAAVDGAYLGETSFFTFPVDATAANTPAVVRFRGSLRIRAHGGMLDVLIADPWIEHHSGGSVLS